jgi:hypothetical protein
MKSTPNEYTDIPSGRYKGLWSGRKVEAKMADDSTREFYTKDGVKGFNVPCKVTVLDGDITVETIDPKI